MWTHRRTKNTKTVSTLSSQGKSPEDEEKRWQQGLSITTMTEENVEKRVAVTDVS